MNYYRRYVGDFQRDTGHLSLTEVGAYDRLLDHYYATEGALPAEMDVLCRICRAVSEEEKAAVRLVVDQFFPMGKDRKRHNRRADHELGVSQQARENGKKGGRPSRTDGVTGGGTDNETGGGTGDTTGSGHPPTTNHQPPSTSLQPSTTKGETPVGSMTRETEIAIALRSLGVKGANGSNPVIIAWGKAGVTVQQATDAARTAIDDRGIKRPSVKYLAPIIEEMRQAPPKGANGASAHSAPESTTCDEIVEGVRCTGPRLFGNRAGTKWFCRAHYPH